MINKKPLKIDPTKYNYKGLSGVKMKYEYPHVSLSLEENPENALIIDPEGENINEHNNECSKMSHLSIININSLKKCPNGALVIDPKIHIITSRNQVD